MSKTNPARGMRDFLPADVRKREYVIGIIKEVYESYGFEPLETPAVENLETLMGKYGEEGNQLIFKILKRGEKLDESLRSLDSPGGLESRDSEIPQSAIRNPQSLSDLALRYDLTVPLARVVANNRNELPKFFKRYQIQPVWRADRPARGRFREFYQCDVDAIGSTSTLVETEIILAISDIFERIGLSNVSIHVNNKKIIDGLMRSVFKLPVESWSHVTTAVDKLEKIGIEGVDKELQIAGLSELSRTQISDFFFPWHQGAIRYHRDPDWNVDLYLDLHGFLNEDEEGLDGVLETDEILESIKIANPKINLVFDPSLMRGLSYYTGTILEVKVPGFSGSIGGGGRYDGLIGMFGKEQIPACGFSLGLERILVVMEERGMFPPEIAESTPADVMVTVWSEDTVSESLKLAAELRSQGLRVTVYPEPDKLGKQIKYADQIKVPYVCVLGETELAEGNVTVKIMKSGEQNKHERSDVSSVITKLLRV